MSEPGARNRAQGPVGIGSDPDGGKRRKTAKNRRPAAPVAAKHNVHVSRKRYGVKTN